MASPVALLMLSGLAVVVLGSMEPPPQADNEIKNEPKYRHDNKKKKGRDLTSTSSESTDGKSGSNNAKDSMGFGSSYSPETSFSSTLENDLNKYRYAKGLNSQEKGWRKWRRKCHPCPADMKRKWRDPRINWICGAYQRARRSFKSYCMMRYRNCQDGTMFTFLHDHRCENQTQSMELRDDGQFYHGKHFFYSYPVSISIDDDTDDSDSGKDASYSVTSSSEDQSKS